MEFGYICLILSVIFLFTSLIFLIDSTLKIFYVLFVIISIYISALGTGYTAHKMWGERYEIKKESE